MQRFSAPAHHMLMTPYRDAPVAALTVRAKPARISVVRVAVAVGGAVTAAGALGLGSAVTTLGVMALGLIGYGYAFRAWSQRNRAIDMISGLPFSVRHDRHAWQCSPLPIDSVLVTLRRPLAAPEREALAHVMPELTVRVADDRIELMTWRARRDHLLVLAELLATWGRTVHCTHGITEVQVTWVRGPAMSL